jgi:pimeloyl-ACP methyl ester carboxylesterase
VVAVPELPGIAGGALPPEDTATQATLLDVLTWMRQDWEYHQTLMPAPATGLAGHSYGGMHAGILATKVAVAGVVSLSGTWGQWTSTAGPMPITELQVPQLFTWGTGLSEASSAAILPDSLWDEVAPPKHRAVFAGGEHFDYLNQFPLPCRTAQGSCPWLGPAAFDLTTMFFGQYLPPELWPNLPDEIPATLVPRRCRSLPPSSSMPEVICPGCRSFTATRSARSA